MSVPSGAKRPGFILPFDKAQHVHELFRRLELLDTVDGFVRAERAKTKDELALVTLRPDVGAEQPSAASEPQAEQPSAPRAPEDALACVRALRWCGGTAAEAALAARLGVSDRDAARALADAAELGLVAAVEGGGWTLADGLPRDVLRGVR